MPVKDDNWESLYVHAKKLADQRMSYTDIEKQLLETETNPQLVSEIVKQLRQTRYAVQRKSGLQKIAFGSLFLVIGFLITCVNFHSNQSFSIVMYSFTSLGLLLIFWGLYDIVG